MKLHSLIGEAFTRILEVAADTMDVQVIFIFTVYVRFFTSYCGRHSFDTYDFCYYHESTENAYEISL